MVSASPLSPGILVPVKFFHLVNYNSRSYFWFLPHILYILPDTYLYIVPLSSLLHSISCPAAWPTRFEPRFLLPTFHSNSRSWIRSRPNKLAPAPAKKATGPRTRLTVHSTVQLRWCPVFWCPVTSFPVLLWPVLLCPVLLCPVILCPVILFPVLLFPVFWCPVPYSSVLCLSGFCDAL